MRRLGSNRQRCERFDACVKDKRESPLLPLLFSPPLLLLLLLLSLLPLLLPMLLLLLLLLLLHLFLLNCHAILNIVVAVGMSYISRPSGETDRNSRLFGYHLIRSHGP